MVILQPLWKLDPIKYLVQENCPELVTFGSTTLRSFTPDFAERRRKAELEGAAFEAMLQKKSPAQIAKLVEQARERDAAKQAKILAAKEKALFYNMPDANADFDYWAKISYWRIDEAVALSFGKDPRVVNWERIKSHVNISTIAAQYAAKRELAERAKIANQISLTTSPSTFLAWAKRTHFDMPAELEAAVTALGIQVADWKTLYDNQVLISNAVREELSAARTANTERMKKHLDTLKDHGERRDALVQGYVEILEAQKRSIAELQGQLDEISNAEPTKLPKDLPPRERETVLKLILGMAVAFYGYDPASGRNPAISQIKSDLALKGVKIDDGTIRKYLDEAKALRPFE